jgi:hypothetical protein
MGARLFFPLQNAIRAELTALPCLETVVRFVRPPRTPPLCLAPEPLCTLVKSRCERQGQYSVEFQREDATDGTKSPLHRHIVYSPVGPNQPLGTTDCI